MITRSIEAVHRSAVGSAAVVLLCLFLLPALCSPAALFVKILEYSVPISGQNKLNSF